MSLLSHDTHLCLADAQIWQKTTHFWPICSQIIRVCEFRVPQKHFKVIIDSCRMFEKSGMVFAQKFVLQTHCYL